jgi:tetratricopeptide (TPR) repeat protein
VSRVRLLLVVVIAAELGVGTYLWLRPQTPDPPKPPLPDLAAVDPLAAAAIREQAANCREPEQWAALGETYLGYGFFPEAEACYRYAKEREPDDPRRWYEWAFAAERTGRLAEANAGFERAAELGHPDPGGCWYYVGRNYLRQRDHAAAGAAFARAGEQPAARYEVARLLVREGRPDEAIPILDRLAAQFPIAVHPPLLRHKIEALRDGPAAVAYADLAGRLRESPTDPTVIHLPNPFYRDWKRLEDAHNQAGSAKGLREAERWLATGDWRAAEPKVRAAFENDWDPTAADLLAEVEFQKDRPAEAVRLLQEAIDRAGPSAHLLARLGDAHLAARQSGAAEAVWARAALMEIDVSGKAASHRLATHLEKTGRAEAARPYHARAWYGAGHEIFGEGRYAAAKEPLEWALKFDPQSAAAWFYLGECHRLTGRPDDARAAYRHCLDIDPDYGRAHAGLALLETKSR